MQKGAAEKALAVQSEAEKQALAVFLVIIITAVAAAAALEHHEKEEEQWRRTVVVPVMKTMTETIEIATAITIIIIHFFMVIKTMNGADNLVMHPCRSRITHLHELPPQADNINNMLRRLALVGNMLRPLARGSNNMLRPLALVGNNMLHPPARGNNNNMVQLPIVQGPPAVWMITGHPPFRVILPNLLRLIESTIVIKGMALFANHMTDTCWTMGEEEDSVPPMEEGEEGTSHMKVTVIQEPVIRIDVVPPFTMIM